MLLQPKAQPDLETLLAEKRKQRAAILAKYSQSNTFAPASPLPDTVASLSSANRALTPSNGVSSTGTVSAVINSPAKRLRLDSPVVAAASTSAVNSPKPDSATNSPKRARSATPESDAEDNTALFDLEKVGAEENAPGLDGLKGLNASGSSEQAEPEVSAADYNPDEDRKMDDARQLVLLQTGPSAAPGHVGATAEVDPAAVQQVKDEALQSNAAAEDEEEEEVEIEVEVAADEEEDDDDMFAMEAKPKKTKLVKVKKGGLPGRSAGMVVSLALLFRFTAFLISLSRSSIEAQV